MLFTYAEAAGFTGGNQNDAGFQRLCKAVDRWVKNYCGREFETAEYTENLAANGTNCVWVKESPITAISDVRIDYSGLLGTDTALDDLTPFVTDGSRVMYTNGYFPRGRRTVQITYTGGYAADEIPEDLKQAAMRLLAKVYKQAASEPMVAESMGDYSYTRIQQALDQIDYMALDFYRTF